MPKSFYITVLLYNDAGFQNGLSKYQNLPNPERFWLTINPTYNTDGCMADILDAMTDIFDAVNAGQLFVSEYDWAYATPGVDGLYLYPATATQAHLTQLENDLKTKIGALATTKGFHMTSDVRAGLQYQFQQMKFEKN